MNRTTISDSGTGATSSGTTSVITEDTTEITPASSGGGDPSLLAGKFKTQDELVKAYKSLESKLGQPKTDTTSSTETPKVTAPVVKAVPTNDAFEIPAPSDTPTPLDLSEFNAELSKDGKLSEASLTKLAKRGIPKEAADVYVAGLKAQAEQSQSRLDQRVGGKDARQALFQWASQNLSKEEVATINVALKGNEAQAALALDGLNARFTLANGKDPKLATGEGRAGTSGLEPFKGNDDLVAAMRDPRYRTSESYRANVEARLAIGL